MASPANVATPLIGLAVVVPRIVALVGFVPSAILIGSVALVSGVPEAVWTITCTAGEIGVPAIVAVGWVTKTSRGGGASVGLLHAPDRKGAAALAIPTTTLVAQPVLRKRIRRSFKGWVNACSAGPANPRRGWHVDFSVMRLRRNNDARTKSHTPAQCRCPRPLHATALPRPRHMRGTSRNQKSGAYRPSGRLEHAGLPRRVLGVEVTLLRHARHQEGRLSCSTPHLKARDVPARPRLPGMKLPSWSSGSCESHCVVPL